MATSSVAAGGRALSLTIGVLTRDPDYLRSVLAACEDASGVAPVLLGGASPAPGPAATDPVLEDLAARARAFLTRIEKPLAVTVVAAADAEQLVQAAAAARAPEAGPLGVLFIDAASSPLDEGLGADPAIEAIYARLGAAGVTTVRSPYSVLVHRAHGAWTRGLHATPDRHVERVRSPELPWVPRIEQLGALMDFVERTLDRPRNHKAALRDTQCTLADHLVSFLDERAGSNWLLLYYTATSVTPQVEHLERAAASRGVLALRAANEHGLACGALANHLIHNRPFLCIIGLAMVDEMRGTLANLREARARGFVIVPEGEPSTRFPFQGTVHADEDSRAMLAGRRAPCVHIESPEVLRERLEEAYRLFDAGQGPVFLLVPGRVLAWNDPLPSPPARPAFVADPDAVPLDAAAEAACDRALSILNHEPTRVVFQLPHLTAEERALVHDLALRSGAALVDTLGHPGPTHEGGRPIPNHLGTLGLYGFNQRSYAFLHDETGRLRPRAEQCLFLFKSRYGERASMFTTGRREGLRAVQVTDRADHVAPDAEVAVVGRLLPVLRRLVAGLDVDSGVLAHRRAALAAASSGPVDPESRIPGVPMSPNYFFARLGELFGELVAGGFRYTGLYDVGRCSVSAARALPRTDPGYAGWYGRALMGDAPASVPVVASSETIPVIAFVGDGGRSIVADPLPALLDNALTFPERFADRSVVLFYFSNGVYSGIRTYRERLSSRWGGRQTRNIELVDGEGDLQVGPIRLTRKRLVSFEANALREMLLSRGCVHVVTVVLGHNNQDEGFTFVNGGWRFENPSRGS